MKNRIFIYIFLFFSIFLFSCNEKENKYIINYNLDGGYCNNLDYEFFHDEEVFLPVPVKEGFTFTGWYEIDENGNKILIEKIENKNYNLTAIWEENECFELVIDNLPDKLEFYDDEEISFSGLKVSLVSQKNKYELNDYEVLYNELNLGENKITIKYNEYEKDFYIKIIEREKLTLIDHLDYLDKTINSIDYLNYSLKIDNVLYGNKRTANTIICYDNDSFVSTNIYGYEVLFDEYGKIIEKNTNVTLNGKGFVISAHGERVNEIKKLNIGDYGILINSVLYIYDGKNIDKGNNVYLKFYELVNKVERIDNVLEYNNVINSLNNVIPYLDSLYNDYNEETYNYINNVLDNLNINIIDIYDHNHKYSFNDITYTSYIFESNKDKLYIETGKYNDIIHYGGFRNTNSIHYYDKECYRERNKYGYEIAVDKNGIVIEKDIIVNLPEDGFILSGHTSGADYLINNVFLNDKIELTDDTFIIKRDNLYNLCKTVYTDLNRLIDLINSNKEESIPHDYDYINTVINEINIYLPDVNANGSSLYDVYILKNSFNKINTLINLGYSQIIDNSITADRGIWYYPFANKTYDDTSLEGVKNTIKLFKEMGINEVILNPFYGSYCLFENSVYQLSSVLNDCSYGEYGNDYLLCFITEAHKEGITVNAFTQTFANKSVAFIDKNSGYYQIDYNGEKSLGSINYYDICNDELQEILLLWYKELVTKYDFDKIEYDIIRYPSSNLYKYNEVDEINSNKEIIDHGYSEYSVNKFMKKNNYSGDLKELIRLSKEVRNNWLLFKEEELVNFITKCTKMIKEINPDILITAAVLNDYENAKKSYLQDCKKWLELGIIDEVEPMVYTDSENKIIEKGEYYSNLLDGYNFRLGLSCRLTTRNIITDLMQMNTSLKYNGYILFANNLYYDKEFIMLMTLSNHYDYDSNDENELICLEIIDKIENYYSVKNNNSYNDLINALKEFDIDKAYSQLQKVNDEKMIKYLNRYFD